jgi:hypothetical protein
VESLLCPFGTEGLEVTRLKQGCDGIDQDCDCIVDECEEDQIPPTIRLTKRPPAKPFKSIEEARKFLEHNLEVTDDCAVDLDDDISNPLDEDACTKECTFTVSVIDERCDGAPDSGASSATKTFDFIVDRNAPVISCGFFAPQDPNHVSDSTFDPCEGETPPYPDADDSLHINQDCFGGDELIDVNFWYKINVSTGDKERIKCPDNITNLVCIFE